MPGKVRVKIIAGRNLPVMDRSNDSADAYVEIKLANVTYKTDVYRKSLNPQWNTDFYRFEVDDAELQDEPLQIRLMDHDTYTANDAIGKVSISLNPLLLPSSSLIGCGVGGQTTIVSEKGAVMAGWIPVFDTMHGIRGEVNVVVKVDLFSDVNKFRQSSCGVQFFHSPNIPHGNHAQIIHGFVEELVVNDDPEYQWIDKIRTPRASNDARQLVFLRLSGQVQRKIGLKAIDLGANAVIGYTLCFDLEGDVGVVARGIGTAVTLERTPSAPTMATAMFTDEQLKNLKFFQKFDRPNPFASFDCFTDISASIAIEPPTPDTDPDAISLSRALRPPPSLPFDTISHADSIRTLFEPPNSAPTPANPSVDGSAEDLANLRQLLDQEDGRGEKPHSRLKRRIQHIGRQSRNVLGRTRLLRRKSRDEVPIPMGRSLSDSLSELSLPASLADLKGAILARPKAGHRRLSTSGGSSGGGRRRRSSGEGSGMAALLVSSMRAAPSLNSIKESAAGDETIGAEEPPPTSSTSLLMVTPLLVERPAVRQRRAGVVATPPSMALGDSASSSKLSVVSSVTSLTSMSSISEIDDDDADDEGDSEAAKLTLLPCAGDAHLETVSMVVQTVLAEEQRKNEELAAQQCRLQLLQQQLQPQPQTPPPATSTLGKSVSSGRFTLDSVVLPSYLQPPKADNDSEIWIQPGSTVDEPEIHDSRRESMFHDLKENIFETMHTLQDHMHISGSSDGGGTAGGENSDNADQLFQMAVAQMLRQQAALMGAPAECLRAPSEATSVSSSKESSGNAQATATAPPSSMSAMRTHSFKLKSLRRRFASFCTRATSPALVSLRTMLPRRLRTRSESDKTSPAKMFGQPKKTAGGYQKAMSLSPPRTTTAEEMTSSKLGDPPAESYGSTIDLSATKMTRIRPFISLHDLTQSATSGTVTDAADAAAITDTNHAVLLAPPPPPPPTTPTPSSPSPPSSSFASQPILTITTTTITNIASPPPPSSSPSPPPPPPPQIIASVRAGSAVTASGTHSSVERTTTASASTAAVSRQTSTTTAAKDIGHVRAESSDCSKGSAAAAAASMAAGNGTAEKESAMCRRSSDSDLAVTPKANHTPTPPVVHQQQQQRTLPPPIYNARASSTKLKLRQLHPDSLDMLEYPFLTLSKYPAGFILHIGATVCARSVKLLERVPNPDEPETRDSWWKELRMEIRSHARTLGCNVILGYTETTSISDEVCVLSASGTAGIINVSPTSGEFGLLNPAAATKPKTSAVANALNNNEDTSGGGDKDATATSKSSPPKAESAANGGGASTGDGGPSSIRSAAAFDSSSECANCSLCHIPYSRASVPFNAHMKKCLLCRNAIVPDVLLATIELPDSLPLTGRGCFLQAQVCRTKKDLKSESNAKEISDCLPFLEYDLHRLLINKLKMKGMNAIFGLKSTVTIGEKVIALIATGTGVYVPALPPPTLPKIVAGNSWTNTDKLAEFQRALQETVDRNREVYQLKSLSELEAVDSAPDDSGDDEPTSSNSPELHVGAAGGTRTFVLEVDDIEDLEIIALLMEPCPPDGFNVVNTQTVPGVPAASTQLVRNLQMFTQIWRAKLGASGGGHHQQGSSSSSGSNFARHFQRLLQTIFFKLRTMLPCAICDLRFNLALPDTDEIQLLVTGMAIGLCDPAKLKQKMMALSKERDDELIFNLDEEHHHSSSQATGVGGPQHHQHHQNHPHQQHSVEQQRSIKSPGHHLVQTGSLKVNPSAHTEHHRKFAAASRVVRERYGVELTPLSYVPGGNVQKYLGNLNFFFIRESTSIRESGGVSGFVHSFITEMLAVVRAHVTALGGNALVSFYMTELELVDNPHKNQGQCLISVGGDVVFVSYYAAVE